MDSGFIVLVYLVVINMTEFEFSPVRICDLSQLNRCKSLE